MKRLAGWLAILAMALQALWPLIAQARPATLVSVCSAGGVTHQIELPDGDSPRAGHCPLCVIGAPPALASAPAPALRLPPAAAAPRDRAFAVVLEAHPTPGQPRAPPLSR